VKAKKPSPQGETMTILIDPTAEQTPAVRKRLARPASLDGLTIGLLDISKARGNILLDELESMLAEQNVAVKRYMKPTFSRPAPVDLQQKIAAECDVVIEALAD
jgi:hypothetical protein